MFEYGVPAFGRLRWRDESGEDLSTVREAALIFLYRLLFILYAEDRGLLPVNDPRYEDYGLRKPVREHIARRMERRIRVFVRPYPSYYDSYSSHFAVRLTRATPSIGLPPYNGGLFSGRGRADATDDVRAADDDMLASLIYRPESRRK